MMDVNIREVQNRILKLFSKECKDFALAGGTALELYYLHHRFSADLDFFSPAYKISEIDKLISVFKKQIDKNIKLESELIVAGKAKVRFYSMPVKGSERGLKIDFVEDVLIDEPVINVLEGVRVYSAENIYFQKIAAVGGTQSESDAIGRPVRRGERKREMYLMYICFQKRFSLCIDSCTTFPELCSGGWFIGTERFHVRSLNWRY